MISQQCQLVSLRDRIENEGIVLPGGVLKVDSFLNQRVNMPLMKEIGEAFAKEFCDVGADVILTIESSGIAPAAMTAYAMGLPLVIGKKQVARFSGDGKVSTIVRSYTKGNEYELSVRGEFIGNMARVLLIDDFLAMGEAALGAARLVDMACGKLVGVGVVIEKAFQGGRQKLTELGITVRALSSITSME